MELLLGKLDHTLLHKFMICDRALNAMKTKQSEGVENDEWSSLE